MQRQPTAKEKSSTLGRGGAHNDGRAQSTRSTPPSANRNSRRIPAPLLLLLFSMTASSCSNCFVSAAAAGESRRPRPAGRRSTHNLKNRLRRTNTNAEEEESALPSTNPSIGTFNALIVLVQFPEHSNRTLPPPSYFQNLCNTEIVPYLLDQSYQQYLIKDCDVLPWRVTNQSQAYFANGESNMKGEDRAADFAAPVLDQWDADDSIDWSKYDRDGDGLLDAVMLVHSGWSAEMLEGLECGAAPWCVRCFVSLSVTFPLLARASGRCSCLLTMFNLGLSLSSNFLFNSKRNLYLYTNMQFSQGPAPPFPGL